MPSGTERYRADSTSMAHLAALVRDNTTLGPRPGLAPQPSDVRVGDAGRLLLRRPAAVRPDQGRPVADRRSGPPGHRPDRVPHRLGRGLRQRQRAVGPGRRLHVAGDHRGRREGRGPQRLGPHAGRPRALRRAPDRRHDEGVGAARRPPAGRAGADLPRHLRHLRPDDRRGDVPVPDPRRRLDGGAPRRRRRDAPRRGGARPSTCRPTPTRPSIASASTPTRSGIRLAELGFHDEMVRKAYEQRLPIVEEFEHGGRRRPAVPVPADHLGRRRSPAASCWCATSPICASATAC